jgi:hypothetical protein
MTCHFSSTPSKENKKPEENANFEKVGKVKRGRTQQETKIKQKEWGNTRTKKDVGQSLRLTRKTLQNQSRADFFNEKKVNEWRRNALVSVLKN